MAPAPRPAPRPPSVVFVGLGKLGGALARRYRALGHAPSVLASSRKGSRRAAKLRVALADEETLQNAELCILAVPDKEVARAAARVAPRLSRATVLVHCAGALTLDDLGPKDALGSRPRGSFHPLCALSSDETPIEGFSVAVSGSSAAGRAKLHSFAKLLGLQPFEVSEKKRAVYHAGAVLAAGAAVSLLSSAAEAFHAAGIPEPAALRALTPLMRSALLGVEQRGLVEGLTGPLVRGDMDTIHRHLGALPQHLASIYRTLSLQALPLASSRLSPAQLRSLRALLNTT